MKKEGTPTFKKPVPSPINAVPRKRENRFPMLRMTTPNIITRKDNSMSFGNPIFSLTGTQRTALKAKSHKGSVVSIPPSQALRDRLSMTLLITGPTVPIGERIEKEAKITPRIRMAGIPPLLLVFFLSIELLHCL